MTAPEDATTLTMPRIEPEPRERGRAYGIAVRVLAALCLAVVAALAFRVSFRAISEVWVSVGAGDPADSWIAPLLIDGLIVVASLNALANAVDGRRVVYPWVLVGVASAVSVAANVAHAAPSLGARALAACAPMVLLAAAELVVRDLRRALERTRTSPASPLAPAQHREVAAPHRESSPPVVVHNTIHTNANANANAAATNVSTDDADVPAALNASAVEATSTVNTQVSGISTRQRVESAWRARELTTGQRLSAQTLAEELSVNASTVRGELSRLRRTRTPAHQET